MVASPIRDRQAERRSATRAEILAAAWQVARVQGLAGVTLRDVATYVGMKPPSLYSHFASKNAVFDAMFRQAWTEFLDVATEAAAARPADPRAALKMSTRIFFEFAVEDPARYLLMNQPVIPGFEPTPESYAPSVRVMETLRHFLAAIGIKDQAGADLFTAITGGLVNQQLANDPGGTRWERLIDRTVDMYADEMGLPGSPRRRKR